MTSPAYVFSGACNDDTSGDGFQNTDLHSKEAIPEFSNNDDLSPEEEEEKGEVSRHVHTRGKSKSSFGCCRRSSPFGASVSPSSVGLVFVTMCLLCLADVGLGKPINKYDVADRHSKRLEAQAVKYLADFGYLKGPSRETQELKTREELVRAIKALQRAGGISETGVIDTRTAELISKPRCGNPDDFALDDYNSRRRFSHHRSKRYTLATSKWPNTNLTFRFVNYTPDMPQLETRKIISNALRVWSDETPLSFTEVRSSQADIMVKFASNYHSDGYPFDGRGMVLAHAFFPAIGRGGDTHFDDDEEWNPKNPNSMDLFMVAAHEFGHALGLAHSGDSSALMYPWYMGVDGAFRLPEDDKRGITHLYGTGEQDRTLPGGVNLIPNRNYPVNKNPTYDRSTNRPTEDSDSPPDPCNSHIDALTVIRKDIFLFIGKWYWRMDSRKLVTNPMKIRKFWYGLPKNLEKVDAIFERMDGKIVFFSGDKYWIFNANQVVKGFPLEGRPITEYNIPADVKNIDAAFVWGYNNRTYLVSGDMYWKMNVNNTFVEYDYPRDMRTWKGVPVPLDAAYKDVSGKTYFFKGSTFYEFYDVKMETRSGYPKRIDLSWLDCPQKRLDESNELRHRGDKSNTEKTISIVEGKKKSEKSSPKGSGGSAEKPSCSKVLILGLLLMSFYHLLKALVE